MSLSLLLLSGIALAACGVVLSLWGFFVRGRSGRRARCPRCWYSMVGTLAQETKPICPECGRTIEGTRRLYRTRRHWRVVFFGLTLVLGGLALGTVAKASGKPWQRSVPATILVFLVSPDDVGDGLAHATWDELRARAKYDQLAAWQRRRLTNAIGRTLNDRDVTSRLAALEAIESLSPPRSAVLSDMLGGLLRDGPTPAPPPIKSVTQETEGGWIIGSVRSHPPRPERYQHDDLVVRLLGRVGTSTDVPILIDVLQSREWFHQRSEALWALAVLNEPSSIAALCDISVNTPPWTEVVVALALFGDRGGEKAEHYMRELYAQVIPSLHPFLEASLSTVTGETSHVSIALSEVLRHDAHVFAHNYASDALRKLGPTAEPAVPTLIVLLSSELEWRRRTAAAILGSIGPGAKASLPDLERLVNDEDRYVSKAALWAIDQIRRPD